MEPKIAFLIVAWVGIGLIFVSWIFFRKPSVPFNTSYAPVWRANEFLNPAGKNLLIAGGVISAVGIAVSAALHFIQ